MAHFKKEELFGPSVDEVDGQSTGNGVDKPLFPDDSSVDRRDHPRLEGLPDLLEWAASHRRLAIVGAFSIGVFLGAVARK